MAKRKQSEPPKNDFAPGENEEILGFTSEPISTGKCISSFSFDDNTPTESINVTNPNTNSSLKFNNTIPSNNLSNNKPAAANDTNPSNNKILAYNRNTPVANGITPPIDGEYLDTKRTYMLRASTVRKINELKHTS